MVTKWVVGKTSIQGLKFEVSNCLMSPKDHWEVYSEHNLKEGNIVFKRSEHTKVNSLFPSCNVIYMVDLTIELSIYTAMNDL